MKIKTAMVALLAMMCLSAAAQSAEYNLRFSHFFPTNNKWNTDIFQPWAKAVEEQSGGRIHIEIYPAGTLTSADRMYQGTINGVSDISIAVQAYSAGRFPLTEIVELPPFGTTAAEGSCVVQSLYDDGVIDQEYSDTHVLFLLTHGPGFLHTTDKPVHKPQDLAGLRLRRPTTLVADMLEHYKAKPVGMPAPEVYASLQRGVVDGLTMPWEGVHVFRLNELEHYHTEVPIYRLAFVMTMNKATYNSLPPDLQKVIDDNSGMAWSIRAGKVVDEIDTAGRKEAVEDEDSTIYSSDDLKKAWEPALTFMKDHYLEKLRDEGLPADKVFAQAQDALAQCRDQTL